MPHNTALRLRVNPHDMEAEIGIDFLARCFGESWNRSMYHWYLQRVFAGEATDRLVLVDSKRVVATAGIAYRQVQTPDAAIHRVGIMVAACTVPGERGRGCFSQLLKDSVEHCVTRRCTALLGFVTADNPTYRGLLRVGAAAVPSSYIISDDAPHEPVGAVLDVADVATSRWLDYANGALQVQGSTAVARFHYPDANAWRSQFVDRPHPVQLLRVGDTSRVIIERVGDTDRLQWLDGDPREHAAAIVAVVERARRARRRFFMYSTTAALATTLQDRGLKFRPGFMMALATRTEHEPVVRSWSTLPWCIHSGDRL